MVKGLRNSGAATVGGVGGGEEALQDNLILLMGLIKQIAFCKEFLS